MTLPACKILVLEDALDEVETEVEIVNEGDYQGFGGIGGTVVAMPPTIAVIEDDVGAVDKSPVDQGHGHRSLEQCLAR